MPTRESRRIRAAADFARRERRLTRTTLAALRQYAQLVRPLVLDAHALTAAADPEQTPPPEVVAAINLAALEQGGEWLRILDATVLPDIDGITDQVTRQILAADHPEALTRTAQWRLQWLADRRQVLARVPDDLARDVRAAIADDIRDHGPDPRSAERIVREYLADGSEQWRTRAATIARTEVVGASNQASLAAWSEIEHALAPTGATVRKEWLATSDGRTRESHAHADGQQVGIGESFTVDGHSMSGPGDPAAPAELVINCRCAVTYEVVDAPADDRRPGAPLLAAAEPVEDAVADDDQPVYTGAYILAMPTAEDAAGLAVDGGDPPEAMHITVAFLASEAAEYDPDQRAAIEDALRAAYPGAVGGDVFAAAIFNPNDAERDPCAVYLVQSAALAALRDGVLDALAAAGAEVDTTFPIWQPHITAGYGLPVDALLPQVDGRTIVFDRLVMAWGEEQVDVSGAAPADDTEPSDTADDPEAVTAAATPGGTAMRWTGVLCPIDVKSSDGRMIGPDVTFRPFPMPILWQQQTDAGHDGSVIVGRMLEAEVRDGELVGSGDFLDSDAASQAIDQVRAGLGGISVDLAPQVVEFRDEDGNAVDPDVYEGDWDKLVMYCVESELLGATICATPAFAEARIELSDDAAADEAEPGEDTAAVVAALVAAGQPTQYPRDWFEPADLDGPTPLTITADGRVYGHLAAFGTCHTGFPGECVTAPRSPSGYAFFHLGEVDTDKGALPVGKLTVGRAGHANPKAGMQAAIEHYDNTATAAAVVRAYDDEHGIQVCGAVLASASEEQVAELRRSPLSGDWRRVGGALELIGALAVNVPGFPVPRAALSASGAPTSLVAAGVIRDERPREAGEPAMPERFTLPSGATLSADDVAMLAAAFRQSIEPEAVTAGHGGSGTPVVTVFADDARSLRARSLRARLRLGA